MKLNTGCLIKAYQRTPHYTEDKVTSVYRDKTAKKHHCLTQQFSVLQCSVMLAEHTPVQSTVSKAEGRETFRSVVLGPKYSTTYTKI